MFPLACDSLIEQLLLMAVASAIPGLTLTGRGEFASVNTHIVTAATTYRERRGSIIESTQVLSEMLLLTDLTRELPANLLRPFPALYFHGLALHAAQAPDIEGAFLFEHLEDSKRHRTVPSLTLIPVRRDQHGTIWLEAMTISILDETLPMVDWLKQHASGDWPVLLEAVAKVLLYLGLRDARQQEQTPYSDASRNFKGLGRRKRTQRLRQLSTFMIGYWWDRIPSLAPLLTVMTITPSGPIGAADTFGTRPSDRAVAREG